MNNTTDAKVTQFEKMQWNEPTVTQLSINLETLAALALALDGLTFS